jgi:cytochrome c-type biogenesis protein CcmF
VDAGSVSLAISLVVTLYVIAASFLGAILRIPSLIVSGRYGFYTVPFLLVVSSGALVYAFVTHDFSVQYVAENSNLAMPTAYTWVAMYAGNSGSMLFIALIFTVMAVVAVKGVASRLPETVPYVTGLVAGVLGFFLGVLVFLANPMSRLSFVPADGEGINPLLVHFGMFIHPPIQMAGLVSVAIPFSIAMGALLSGRGGRDEWVDVGRIWGMFSWLVLTGGLMLGSWWAYTILGWGGYWAWDPVENSALMPWLVMTAFVHSIMVQKRRGMFRMWNIVLVSVAFTMAQMGMFINRGGPVPSVHSFAQSAMGWIFLAFMVSTLLGSLVAFAWRMDSLKSRERLESMLSRESFFILQNLLFLIVAFVTLWGTVYPVIADALLDESITVGEPYFNRVNGPVLFVIVLIMGVGPLVPWRRGTPKNIFRMLRYPVAVAVSIATVLVVSGMRQPVAILALATCSIVITGILAEWVRGSISRHKKGENYIMAWGRLVASNRPRYGGYVVHLAIIMLTVGAIGSSFFNVQRDFALSPGQSASLRDYSFRYIGFERKPFSDREEVTAHLELSHLDRTVGPMYPTRSFYPDFRIGATKAAIRSTIIEDFYVVPSEFGDDGGAVFRVYINPMVWWMWAAGPVLFVGTLLAISPRRRRVQPPNRPPIQSRSTSSLGVTKSL